VGHHFPKWLTRNNPVLVFCLVAANKCHGLIELASPIVLVGTKYSAYKSACPNSEYIPQFGMQTQIEIHTSAFGRLSMFALASHFHSNQCMSYNNLLVSEFCFKTMYLALRVIGTNKFSFLEVF
jgi:hypothetical protein